MAEERRLGPEGLFDADTLVFVKLSVSQEGHPGPGLGLRRRARWDRTWILTNSPSH